jgi:hypothetical protein
VKKCQHCGKEHRKPLPQDEAFAAVYVQTLNASESFRQSRPNYRGNNVAERGRQVLNKPTVQCLIRRGAGRVIKKAELSAEKILADLLAIATFDLRSLFDVDGNLLAVKDWPEDAGRIVAGLEQGADGVKKVKLPDRHRSYEMLAKHLGLLKETVDTNVTFVVHTGIERTPDDDVVPDRAEGSE